MNEFSGIRRGLAQALKRLKSWWGKLRRKNFQITGEYTAASAPNQLIDEPELSPPARHSFRRKRFTITGEHSAGPNQTMGYDQPSPPVSGFSVVARTRPKRCPVCHTADRIVRVESMYWKCEECGHTWR